MLTNSRWWTNIVLEGGSAELWHLFPARFSLADLASRASSIGIDMEDAETRAEVLGFLGTLHSEGLLSSATLPNPKPDPSSTIAGFRTGAASNSVEADFYDWLSDRGVLPSALIELTYRCNQRCVHCFNPGAARSPSEMPRRSADELTTEEIGRVLVDLAEMGVFTLTFSGGEPSLRVDLIEILREARSLGFSFNVYSNGQLPDSLLRQICDLWPRAIGISLYSAVPDIHDATTGVKGSFDRALESLRLVAGSGVRAMVKCPLMQHTVFGYKRLLELCDELNALPQFDFQITAGMDGDERCTVHQILDRPTLRMIMADPRVAMHVGPETLNYGRQNRPIDGPVCGAGRYTVSIAPDGTVYPCNGLPLTLGNVRAAGLRAIWHESKALAAWKAATLADFDQCGLYSYCSYCNHCPGMAMVETGDLLAVSKTCCTTALARMELSKEFQASQSGTVDNAATFGFDEGVRLPTQSSMIAVSAACPSDPRAVPGDGFAERIAQIQREGNTRRRAQVPERDSPADQNLTEANMDRSSRLRELGR
jgi:radical SAM protein with 4Fe4S-binding SPASM domain